MPPRSAFDQEPSPLLPNGERGFSNIRDGTVNACQSEPRRLAKGELKTFTLAVTFKN